MLILGTNYVSCIHLQKALQIEYNKQENKGKNQQQPKEKTISIVLFMCSQCLALQTQSYHEMEPKDNHDQHTGLSQEQSEGAD